MQIAWVSSKIDLAWDPVVVDPAQCARRGEDAQHQRDDQVTQPTLDAVLRRLVFSPTTPFPDDPFRPRSAADLEATEGRFGFVTIGKTDAEIDRVFEGETGALSRTG